jgi:hypothetical protein
LMIRLYFRITPRNVEDVYHLLTEEEQKDFNEQFKTKKGMVPYIDLESSKFNKSKVIKKYLDLFQSKYTISSLAKLMDKQESSIAKLKKSSFQQLKEIIDKKNLRILLE